MSASDIFISAVCGFIAVIVVETTRYLRWRSEQKRLRDMRLATEKKRGKAL